MNSGTQPRPLIGVSDVSASSRWYQQLLDCESGHGGNTYEQLVCNGHMLLQLHAWDDPADQHEHLGSPDLPLGNGVLLWFAVEDFEAARARAVDLEATILDDLYNPNARQREIWLRDPDGYVVVLAGPSGFEPQ